MTKDEALIHALFQQIEKTLGPHVQAIMVFRDTKKRLMWVASPYDPDSTRMLLEVAFDNVDDTPVESVYRQPPEES